MHESLSYTLDSAAMKTRAVGSSKNLGHTIITWCNNCRNDHHMTSVVM